VFDFLYFARALARPDGIDNTVNMFDFVVVAKYFGKPQGCVIDLDTVEDINYCARADYRRLFQ
jgi:hypothetical protein